MTTWYPLPWLPARLTNVYPRDWKYLMIVGSAATVAGSPDGALCMRMTGWACGPPSDSASEIIRFTQEAAAEPFAFQSSVSTDQLNTRMFRCWARLSRVGL